MEHKPRRVVIALLIAIIGIGSAWATGVATADDEIPAHFAVPAPRPGDAGVYEMTVIRDGEPVWTVPYLRFEISAVPFITADGQGVLAHRVDHDQAGWHGTQSGTAWSWGDEYGVVYKDGQSLYSDFLLSNSVWDIDPRFGGPDIQVEGRTVAGQYHIYAADGIFGQNCLVLHPLQGGADTSEAVRFLMECDLGWDRIGDSLSGLNFSQTQALGRGGHGELSRDRFHAVAMVDRGEPTLVYRDENGTRDFWFTGSSPFVVRAELQDGDDRIILRLVEETRTPATFPSPPPDAPAWRMAPAEPWLGDDAGWEAASPSEAWDAAREHSEVQAFLDSHPGMGPDQVTYRDEDDAERWEFRLRAPDAGIKAIVAFERPRPDVDDPTALLFSPTPAVSVEEDVPGAAHPRLARFPSWESMRARGEAFLGAPVHYLSIDARGYVGAGYQDLQRSLRTDGTVGETYDLATASMNFERDGQAWGWIGGDFEGRQDILAPAAPPPSREELQSAPATDASFGVVFVATAGAGAVLIAFLYYFAPAIKTGSVGLFSRIRTDRLLDHPVRQAIVDAVAADPGLHLKDLQRAVGTAPGATQHHLEKLVDGGLVRRFDGAGYTCLFPPKTDRRFMQAAPALRHDTARLVMQAISQAPGITGSALAGSVSVGRSTIVHHLDRLEEAGLIERRRDGNKVRLYATETARSVLPT